MHGFNDIPVAGGSPSQGFEEALAYLVLFSDALLDLVPDPVCVLDDALRVRHANGAFAEAFDFESQESARGSSLADHPLLGCPIPWRPGRTLADAFRELFNGFPAELAIGRLDVAAPAGATTGWAIRARAWDTEDPSYRRILAWFRRLPAAPAPVPGEPRASRPEAAAESASSHLLEGVLEALPQGACVLDAELHLVHANARAEELLGRDLPRGASLIERLPELQEGGLPTWIDAVRHEGPRFLPEFRVTRRDGPAVSVEIEVQPIPPRDDEPERFLLLFREVPDMTPSPTTSDARPTVPETPDGILDEGHLVDWPPPATDRVLVVESDSWTRMVIADLLRAAGLSDFALCDSGAAAWARHDPGFFAAVLVGLDSSPEDAMEFCRRVAREAAHVPAVALTERPAEEARSLVAGLRLAGLLVGPLRESGLSRVAPGLARRGPAIRAGEATAAPPATPVAEPAGTAGPALTAEPAGAFEPLPGAEAEASALPSRVEPDAAVRPYEVIVLGAREDTIGPLRTLVRTRTLHVGLVYDPDPAAPGLALAESAGLETAAGPEPPRPSTIPHIVVLMTAGLESAVGRMGLDRVPRVLREEVELFAAEPAFFVSGEVPVMEVPERMERAAAEPPAEEGTPPARPIEVPAAPEGAAEAAPRGEPAPAGGPIETPAPTERGERPAGRESPVAPPPVTGPPSFAEPSPGPADTEAPAFPAPTPERPPAARVAPDSATPPAQSSDLDEDLGSLTGAFDLLFDFDRLCTRVLDTAIAAVDAPSGSLMLIDDEGRYLRIVAAVGLSDVVVQETRQRLGQGISGRVAVEGEPLLLVGTIGDERFPVRGERPEIPSAACVPIAAEGRVLGVLNVNSDPRHEPFDQPQLRRLAEIGRRVGPAIDRAWQLRVVRGRSFEMSVRGAIESIASSREDFVTRIRQVASRVLDLLHVDTCAIWLHDPKDHTLWLRAVAGARAASIDAVSIEVGTGLAGWVGRHRRRLVLRNAPDDPADGEAARIASIVVPIRYQTDLVGVLAIESASGTLVDDKKIALAETVASVLGEQIGASRAQESSERMVTMLSALAELGVAFSAARDRTNLGRLVAFTAATVLESDVATVRLVRPQLPPGAGGADAFELVAAHGASPGEGDPLTELEERAAREVASRCGAVTERELPGKEAESLLTRSNVASLLAVPFGTEEEMLGIVVSYRVTDARGRDVRFGEQDREIAMRLGDYAAAAAQRFGPSARSAGAGGEVDA